MVIALSPFRTPARPPARARRRRRLLRAALAALDPASLRAVQSSAGPAAQSPAAYEAVSFAPTKAAALEGFFRCAGAALARAALVAPRSWRDLLGAAAAGAGRSGEAAGCVRRQYARAAARSMAQVGRTACKG